MNREYDVLIAGTGAAGLYGALRFPENVSVLLISKRELSLSNSSLAQGGVAAVLDTINDDYQLHIQDTLTAGKNKNNIAAVEVLVKDKTDQEALRTAELIEETFNSNSTGIRKEAGQVRLRELQVTMNALYSQLEQYQHDPSDKKTIRMLNALLNRASIFSGFTRSYAREWGYEIISHAH